MSSQSLDSLLLLPGKLYQGRNPASPVSLNPFCPSGESFFIVSQCEQTSHLLLHGITNRQIPIARSGCPTDEFSAFHSGGRPSLTVSIGISLIRYKASFLHGSFPWPSSGALDY